MATYYAWAPISHHNGEKFVRILPGDEVDTKMFTKSDVEYFKTEGIIRPTPFPQDVRQGESVRTHLLRKANEARDQAEVPYRELMNEIGMDESELPPQHLEREGEEAPTPGAPSS